ncbi:MAG: protein kinase [Planctomycetaceae bacterium]|nr:protein kinase [Planctomycetaceae bacterium]
MPKIYRTSQPDTPFIDLPANKTLTIGRSDECDVTIEDPFLSRKHCRIMWDGKVTVLEDTNSSSGVFVQGSKVNHVTLQHEDEIRIGQTKLRFISNPNPDNTIQPESASANSGRSQPSDMLGKQIAHYQLDSIIAAGTNGVVYRATNTKNQDDVALKILSSVVVEDQGSQDRFVRAMQTMIPIDHPNIVKIYNAGKVQNKLWIAMEYVEGDDLASLISRIGIDGKLGWQPVWHTALQVAYGLREAFNHSIIHRNLLPSNLLRRKTDKMVLIGDLMLAKALDGEHAKVITMPGQGIGEIPYLAPECLVGKQDVDTRSDIYSLGATLYALLTGRPPAIGDTTGEIIKQVRTVVPPRPSDNIIGINEMFEDLVMSMIEKEPVARPATPDLLIQQLVRIANYANIRY